MRFTRSSYLKARRSFVSLLIALILPAKWVFSYAPVDVAGLRLHSSDVYRQQLKRSNFENRFHRSPHILFAVDLEFPEASNATSTELYFAGLQSGKNGTPQELKAFPSSHMKSADALEPSNGFSLEETSLKQNMEMKVNGERQISMVDSMRKVEVQKKMQESFFSTPTRESAKQMNDTAAGSTFLSSPKSKKGLETTNEITLASGNTPSNGLNATGFFSPITQLYKRALNRTNASNNFTREMDEKSQPKTEWKNDTSESVPLRQFWKKRQADTLDEGVRKEQSAELSNLFSRVQIDARKMEGKRYTERILMGLVNALAEEIEDLDIELKTKPKTRFWKKEVESVRINFSRLGFKPIRMGGSDKYDRNGVAIIKQDHAQVDRDFSLLGDPDEAFDRIDKDNSGTLDREEMAEALSMISAIETNTESLKLLASDLVDLYDANSDGVVDREEYQQMVEDMAKLRPGYDEETSSGPLKTVRASVQSISKGISEKAAQVAAAAGRGSSEEVDPNEREMGSIVFSGINLDLRRFVFGNIPIVKRITGGGPLILKPFTATIRGSFTREDVMGSFLLDSGLRLLVARAIRLRVRSFRDLVDGAYFFGRQWKMTSQSAPVVQVLRLSNIEFVKDKMIVTGRARIRASPDAPIVTQSFKVRTKIGTTNNGQSIGLREPELAFVFECPQAIDNWVSNICGEIGIAAPKRPEPLYSFFPIYSPFKVTENAGFNMGEDNKLLKIFVKDGKLRFEMRSVLRPGRFLGNHYLAFTTPIRTFIITMDRVKEGIRVARKNKKISVREKAMLTDMETLAERDFSGRRILKVVKDIASRRRRRIIPSLRRWRAKKPKPKSFIKRFVEGYTLLEREGEANNERLTSEISDWFGRQGSIPVESTNDILPNTETKEEKEA